MMYRVKVILLVSLLLPAYLVSLSTVSLQRKALTQDKAVSYILPSALLKITSLEFDGLTADFLFLKALTFYGGTLSRTERPRIKPDEWRWLFDTLNAATDLDPYFYDPYYFANSNFTWDGNMAKETNMLLVKGSKARSWDWTIPYFMGFNEYYFLHNHLKASEYLMEGSKRPDADPIVASLAVRMAYKASRTEIAITFLQSTLNKTKDYNSRRVLEYRLKSLQEIFALEQAVDTYNVKYGKQPANLKELLEKGLISKIPADPYGGILYLDPEGKVKSTIK